MYKGLLFFLEGTRVAQVSASTCVHFGHALATFCEAKQVPGGRFLKTLWSGKPAWLVGQPVPIYSIYNLYILYMFYILFYILDIFNTAYIFLIYVHYWSAYLSYPMEFDG